jgi:hypothetical protein
MPPEPSNLFSLARSKLQLSVGKDSCSLHRWVLLKNSIIRSQTPTAITAPSDKSDLNCVHTSHTRTEEDYEDEEEEEADSFFFPDAGKLADSRETGVSASEAEWLDSLLEDLADEDEGDFNASPDICVSILPVDDDDDDSLLSPLISPMSSSDDLLQPAYYPPSIPVPYPVPYPPDQPSPIHEFHRDPPSNSQPSSYDDNLPYYYTNDVDDLAVPDAIEDTSDDESDAPSTPSLRHSTSTSSLTDPASIPLPAERRRPHVYIDTDDTYFYKFELDPLPFPEDDLHTYNPVYEEC